MKERIAPRFLRWTKQHANAMTTRLAFAEERFSFTAATRKQSTKRCHWCNSDALALISTQDLKLCVDCGHQMKWKLTEGQKATL